MLKASNLSGLKGIRHGFFTRRGGVSGDGNMGGLNCGFGSDDHPENITENRRLALERLGAKNSKLVTAYQVHSARSVSVDTPWVREDAPEADAMASEKPNVALGILTADCAPVLFADGAARIIGAAHAGWKGARSGILESCVQEMVALGATPGNISAAVGPCIAQVSYEVGPEFHRDFIDEDKANEGFFVTSSKDNHYLFDLTGYVEKRLAKLNLASVEGLGMDTCADPERFYSYRRCTLNGGKDFGRLLSAIVLENETNSPAFYRCKSTRSHRRLTATQKPSWTTAKL